MGRGVCGGITRPSCGLSPPGRRRGTWRGGPLPEVATASLERGQAWPRSSRLQRPFDHTDFQITPSPSSGSLAHTCLCPSPPAEPWAGRDRPQAVRTLHPSQLAQAHVPAASPSGGPDRSPPPSPPHLPCPSPPRKGDPRQACTGCLALPHTLPGRQGTGPAFVYPLCPPRTKPRLQQLPHEDRSPGSPSS